MKKTIMIVLTLLAFSISVTATDLPEVSVNPDSELYDTKTLVEDQISSLAPDEAAEAEAQLHHADKRVVEADQVADERPDLAEATLEDYSEKMDRIEGLSGEIADEQAAIDVQERVAEATTRHSEVLSSVHERVPEEAQEAIEQAMERSVQGHEQAMERLEQAGQAPGLDNPRDNIPGDVRDGFDQDFAQPTEDESEQTTNRVVIENEGTSFVQEEVVVQQGEEIEFVFSNTGGDHDLVISELDEGTEIISGGERAEFTVTFEEEGEYQFECTLHAGMEGTIVVEEEA